MTARTKSLPAALRATLLALVVMVCSGFSGPKQNEPGGIHIPGNIRSGDIIFVQSSSRQSTALEAATDSMWTHTGIILRQNDRWMVAEAAATVRYTPIEEFIKSGKGHRFSIKRLKKSPFGAKSDGSTQLKKQVARYLGKPYDIYFRWDDDEIYCSELVWKVYQPYVSLSKPQPMKEMDLSSSHVKKLIDERYSRNGRKFNWEEKVVTPIALFDSPKLVKLYDSADAKVPKRRL